MGYNRNEVGIMDFFSVPEEVQEKLREHYERHEMMKEEFRHSFQRIFEELPEDHLRTIRTMLSVISDQDESSLAAEWLGMASWALKTRFNVCVTCGVNHDEELAETPPPQEKGGYFEEVPLDCDNPECPDAGRCGGRCAQKFSDTSSEADQPLPMFYEPSEDERKLMDEYHLDDLRDQDSNEFLGFICTGIQGWNKPCGMRYPSIQDRMLREPESCSGCHQRMMHG
jgi:hypothetical protein